MKSARDDDRLRLIAIVSQRQLAENGEAGAGGGGPIVGPGAPPKRVADHEHVPDRTLPFPASAPRQEHPEPQVAPEPVTVPAVPAPVPVLEPAPGARQGDPTVVGEAAELPPGPPMLAPSLATIPRAALNKLEADVMVHADESVTLTWALGSLHEGHVLRRRLSCKYTHALRGVLQQDTVPSIVGCIPVMDPVALRHWFGSKCEALLLFGLLRARLLAHVLLCVVPGFLWVGCWLVQPSVPQVCQAWKQPQARRSSSVQWKQS